MQPPSNIHIPRPTRFLSRSFLTHPHYSGFPFHQCHPSLRTTPYELRLTPRSPTTWPLYRCGNGTSLLTQRRSTALILPCTNHCNRRNERQHTCRKRRRPQGCRKVVFLVAQTMIYRRIGHLRNLEGFAEDGDARIRAGLDRSYNTTKARADLFAFFDRLLDGRSWRS
jgi:hypothetical protein